MPTLRHRFAFAALAVLLAACASKGPTQAHFDFGPLPQAPAVTSTAIAPLIVADMTGPASLDSERMQYRLLYADARQLRPYAYNQWTATPLQLLTQRLKARIAQAGVKVLATTDAAAGAMLLRTELDDFAHNFDSATASQGTITLRASVFAAHHLVDQKSFTRSVAAPTADAAGGARALADAADALSGDLLAWLATLPAPK
ncbi:ABC transporter [Duganella sp. Leaf126]|uniref:ABC-type transport auxiliary lipoprotein family protein n=1 Tax=Duganella sp. Leaf126 TaxID=1736266 RepID=UPI00070199CC|nr:ABC-type transport auxiliary lipoprotein family protein [Duganella sp. Leaf126]KQQ31109.1 ABC transporter [Duganella sp. Leaf126]